MLTNRQLGWIGVDLGTHCAKLAQVQRVGARLRLVQSAVVPRGKRTGLAALTAWGGEELRPALSSGRGFSGRRAACLAPVDWVDFQSLTIPPGTVSERRAMISSELAAIFSGQERQFDFWDSSPGGSPGRDNTHVLSISQDAATQVISCFSAAGLRCEVLDGLPLALLRAVQLAEGVLPATPVAAVDWGYSSATFSIIAEGGPLFTRHLRDCGCKAMVDRISEAFGLSADEAQQVLASHGLPSARHEEPKLREVQEAVADVIAEPLAAIAGELARTFSYLAIHRANLSPQRMWLFGGGGTVRNMAECLTAKVGLPVEGWRLSSAAPVRTEEGDSSTLFGVAAALSALAWMT